MTKQKFMTMLYAIHRQVGRGALIIEWSNGLKIRCPSTTGIFENAEEPEDDDYVGEYSIGVTEIKVLKEGKDDSVQIYKRSMEISLLNIPQKIMTVDGTLLWPRGE